MVARSGKRFEQMPARITATLLRTLVGALGRTWRIEVIEGRSHINALRSGGAPAILALWHDRTVFGAYYTGVRMARAGVKVTVLASGSGDGELVARVMRRWGAEVVRGSSSAGGAGALRKLRRAIRGRDSSVVMVPDGPRGPARRLKGGVLLLARISGAPVLAMGFAADRSWQLNSWDRLIVPRPFARVCISVRRFEPAHGGQDDARDRLQSLLDEVTRRAETALAPDRAPRRRDPGAERARTRRTRCEARSGRTPGE